MGEEARGLSLARMTTMVKTENEVVPAVHAWAWMVRLLGASLTERGSQLINLLLQVPSATFSSDNSKARVATQVCCLFWRTFTGRWFATGLLHPVFCCDCDHGLVPLIQTALPHKQTVLVFLGFALWVLATSDHV